MRRKRFTPAQWSAFRTPGTPYINSEQRAANKSDWMEMYRQLQLFVSQLLDTTNIEEPILFPVNFVNI